MNIDPKQTNSSALAFLGDAVYEVYVREYVLEKFGQNADKLHKCAIKYVCAGGQAKACKGLMREFLTEDEVRIVKRGRNHKTTSKTRSADAVTYKVATGFEALMGHLYAEGKIERLEEIVKEAIRIIEEK